LDLPVDGNFFQGMSAELLAQKERLKKKMQQQIRKTYKVSNPSFRGFSISLRY
jgi:hypothetical protein